MTHDRANAAREIAFCEHVLRKSGTTVLLETLRGYDPIKIWQHYPPGDVYDPESGAQWYYHAHAAAGMADEHGHFHCFVRPEGKDGPVHHLAAVGVDAHGRILRLFTVNQWVVGDRWLSAEGTITLLPRFDVQMARPSYLVNRWLTGVFRLYQAELSELIMARDAKIASDRRNRTEEQVREDRSLEVTSELHVDFEEIRKSLGDA